MADTVAPPVPRIEAAANWAEPGEGGGRHHDGREDAHAGGARQDPVGDAEPEHGDGERRDGAHAVAVVSLAGGFGHGAAHATGRWTMRSVGSLPSFAGGTSLPVGGRRYPLLVPASRITTTAHGLTPERVRHALSGLPRADGYALHVKPLALPATPSPVGLDRLRRAHDHAAGARAVLPVRRDRALRRETATVGPQGWPAKFIWLTEGVTFRTPREVLRFLYCHEWMHVYGTSARGSAESVKQHATASRCRTTAGGRSRSRTLKPRSCPSARLRRASAEQASAAAWDGLRCLRLLTWTRRRRGNGVIDFIEDNHDLIMGAALMIAGVLTVLAIRKRPSG